MSERHSGSGSRSGAGGGTPSTPPIVIASKDANQRQANSAGAADPGPGDMEAAPSEMPQPVEIPEAPTASQLVVKSSVLGGSRGVSRLQTNSGQVGSRSNMELVSGSASGPAASQPSAQAAREPTSSRPLTGPGAQSVGREASVASVAGSGGSGSRRGQAAAAGGSTGTLVESAEPSSPAGASAGAPSSPDGRSHHEEEVGEGEVEHDGQESSPHQQSTTGRPRSTGTGTGAKPASASALADNSTIMSPQAAQAFRQGPSSSSANASNAANANAKPADKKVTRFRYHKRITVRTSGKNNPQAIMSKVNKGVSPSTIGDIDASDLMKRVGIKNTKHWRIRVRQTKRITKNGKTTTQTKTAYRDSSGNLQPPSSPATCKKCSRKQSECRCASSTGQGSSK